MRLYKVIKFFNRLVNEENGRGIGKCVNDNNNYWYRDINLNLIKRNTTKNKYHL